MSKGSQPRPYSVDQKTFDRNWDAIFKKQDNNKDTQEKEKEKEDNNELDKSN